MAVETGETFSPSVRNAAGDGAVGADPIHALENYDRELCGKVGYRTALSTSKSISPMVRES
jgi:hypothetical protein